jgi:dTDP-4-amino-4,6-dideoxygalactose transaminase
VPVYARYPLFCIDKERLLARAEEERIEFADWYRTPVHPLEEADWQAVSLEKGACPRAEEICDQIVSLPVNQKVTDTDIQKTLGFLADF